MFKVNQKVVCVKSYSNKYGSITKGNVYTCSGVEEGWSIGNSEVALFLLIEEEQVYADSNFFVPLDNITEIEVLEEKVPKKDKLKVL